MLFRALSQTFLQPAVSVLKKNRQIALISTQKAFFLQCSRFLLKKINKFRSFNSQKRSFLQPALLLLKNRKASGPSHPIFVGVLFTYTAPTIKRYCFNFPGSFSLMVDTGKINGITVNVMWADRPARPLPISLKSCRKPESPPTICLQGPAPNRPKPPLFTWHPKTKRVLLPIDFKKRGYSLWIN